jgi:hypothetical protein
MEGLTRTELIMLIAARDEEIRSLRREIVLLSFPVFEDEADEAAEVYATSGVSMQVFLMHFLGSRKQLARDARLSIEKIAPVAN